MVFDYTDRVVLITGAGAGIGFGIAKAFYEAGAKVALGDFRPKALERAVGRLEDRERVFVGQVDVRDAESVQGFVEASERALGPIDVAVANAGIYPNTPVLEMTQEE